MEKIYCYTLKCFFENKEEMFSELKRQKDFIISEKKSNVIKSIDKGQSVVTFPLVSEKFNNAQKSIFDNEKYYYIVVNTTNILDSHQDVHLPEIWNKTVKEQQGKNYLLDSHNSSISTTIVRKEDIEMFTMELPFSVLGKSYSGMTTALIYKFPKNKIINEAAKMWLNGNAPIEASVRMQYVDVLMCVNSEDKKLEEEKFNYDKYINQIANKEDFETIDYFFAVKQAKNIHESSLVLAGSNSVTGVINLSEPSNDTQKDIDTLSEPSNEFRKKLLTF